MRKVILAAAAAALAAAMVTGVSADDVVVRTSVGSGEVPFTETSEKVDVTAEELSERMKEATKAANEKETLSVFLDAEANILINFDEENKLEINGSAIGSADKNADKTQADFVYSLSGFGDEMSGRMETYGWEADGHDFSAYNDGSGWNVEDVCAIDAVFEVSSEAIDSKEGQDFELSGLLPNFYEANGQKYYVCEYNKSSIMDTANTFDGAETYTEIADSLLGDNDAKMVLVINAETYLPRALSIDASGIESSIPGVLLGTDESVSFSAYDLYVTCIMDEEETEITIPDEVLNAPVQKSVGEKALEGIENLLGSSEESASVVSAAESTVESAAESTAESDAA